MLRDWMKVLGPDEHLFPKLARRRTWLMVKKDLEKAGIPYITPAGVADLHAAGRHSFITELLRNGVTLPEARALARHSDVNMTMKYTHIGIDDQARAVANLPNPCQRIVSIPGDFEGQTLATPVSAGQHNEETGVDVKPCPVSLCDTEKQKESSGDSPDDSWRREDANRTFSDRGHGMEGRHDSAHHFVCITRLILRKRGKTVEFRTLVAAVSMLPEISQLGVTVSCSACTIPVKSWELPLT